MITYKQWHDYWIIKIFYLDIYYYYELDVFNCVTPTCIETKLYFFNYLDFLCVKYRVLKLFNL